MMMAPPRPLRTMTAEGAQTLALNALAYLLADPDRASRFCVASGVAGEDMANQLGDAAFLGGVLDFVLEDEALLAEIAAAAGLSPEAVGAARRQLPGAPIDM